LDAAKLEADEVILSAVRVNRYLSSHFTAAPDT
jgi:hypothetical protein